MGKMLITTCPGEKQNRTEPPINLRRKRFNIPAYFKIIKGN